MAGYFYDDAVTVPQPIDGDYDFRLFDQAPSQPSPNDGGRPVDSNRPVKGIKDLLAHQNAQAAKAQQAWMYNSLGVLYYAFPIEILWGIVTSFISLVVIARQRKTSNDSYLIGFTIASLLLLICASALKIQDYMPHNNEYQKVLGYIKSANDWLWYSALWLLVVMTLERGLTLIQNRSKNFCSALQASVIIIVIFCVCLVSALPEFWEYEAIETFDYVSNRTIIISTLSRTADSPEYKIMYFWYSVTILVFLPYPIMVTMIVILSQSMKKSRHSKKRLQQQEQIQGVYSSSSNRKLKEQLHLTRLYIVMILLYVLLSGPLTFLVIINGITPYWTWPVDHLYTGLYPIFEFAFYFFFSIQFLLYLTYYDKFRHSFLKTFCWCCCKKRRTKRSAGSGIGGFSAGSSGVTGDSLQRSHPRTHQQHHLDKHDAMFTR